MPYIPVLPPSARRILEERRRQREETITMEPSEPWPRADGEEQILPPPPEPPPARILGNESLKSLRARYWAKKPKPVEDHITLMAQRLQGCEKDKDGNPLPCHGCCHSQEAYSSRNGESLIDFPGAYDSNEPICSICVRSNVPNEKTKDLYHTVDSRSFVFENYKESMRAEVIKEVREEMKLERSKKTPQVYLGKTTLNKISNQHSAGMISIIRKEKD